jgi:RimJ/RimL family protein N-acetyltransferase
VIVAGERVARFVSDRLGFGLTPPYTTMGIEREGEIVAGVIFSCFEGCDVHATVAGKGWTRRFLEEAGRYVFDHLECQRLTFLTEQASVERLAMKLGALREGVLRRHFGYGRDAVVLGVLREDWRFDRAMLK